MAEETPELPFQFRPDHPDQKYFRLGEEPLVGCLRDAVREVCRERWRHVTLVDGWTEFLEKKRFMGQVGQDTNQDGNDVEGLIDYIRTESEHHNLTQHPATNDTKVCSSLVDRFTETYLVDEIILSWAVDEGHVSSQPPFQPKLEKRFTSPEASLILAHIMGVDPKNTTDSGNAALLFKWLELLGRLFPGNSTHVPANATIPRNSTGRGNFTLPDDLWDWLEQFRNNSVRVPGNSTRVPYGHHQLTPTATLIPRGETTPPAKIPQRPFGSPLPGHSPRDYE